MLSCFVNLECGLQIRLQTPLLDYESQSPFLLLHSFPGLPALSEHTVNHPAVLLCALIAGPSMKLPGASHCRHMELGYKVIR